MILLNVNCQIDLLSCDRKKVHTTTRGERKKKLKQRAHFDIHQLLHYVASNNISTPNDQILIFG